MMNSLILFRSVPLTYILYVLLNCDVLVHSSSSPVDTDILGGISSAQEILDKVSKIFQKELNDLQNPSDCTKTRTLLCGHSNNCGLACQLHHRAACVMYSYALNIPLIHDDKSHWPFTKPWTAAFLPIGSPCKPNNGTIVVDWTESKNSAGQKTKQNPLNPLRHGLPIRKKLAETVNNFHASPFVWWVGQFIKYVLRFSPSQQKLIDESRKQFRQFHSNKFSVHTVGLHIRRTDKQKEVKHSSHPLKEYMNEAVHYFEKYFLFEKKPRSVMIASDDHTILQKAQQSYRKPKWNVYGFKNKKTLKSQEERKDYLMETIRDFMLLAETDFIVCGLASQVCRLLMEVKVTTQLNATQVFTSLDDGYSFGLNSVYCPQLVVPK